MPKISQLPPQASPTVSDKVPIVSGGTTDYALLSDIITLFFNNIPTGAHSDVTRGSETIFDHVASGLVWSGDSVGVNRNASMTSGITYINGRRISISAVTARTFTASKDTYIDILDNQDGTGTLVYTEVTNNAASPALAANSIRIGIIVTGATTIAAAGSVNQGQETKVLPIVSSQPYQVTDSLGNLICGRDPSRKLLGYRQNITGQAITTEAVITGLIVPFIIPTGRKIAITAEIPQWSINGASTGMTYNIRNGTTTAATLLNSGTEFNVTSTTGKFISLHYVGTLTAGAQNVCATGSASSSTLTIVGSASIINTLKIELV